MDIYEKLREELRRLAGDSMDEGVAVVSARPLPPKEAIGETGRDDYPLLKGKEAMVEAVFRGSKGHAFTDMPGGFEGSIRDVISLPLQNNFERAVFIATVNAVMRDAGLITGTVHCRDDEPGRCARELVAYVREKFGDPRIAFVGFQPGMIERLSEIFQMRVLDLDKDNIGRKKSGIIIEGPDATDDVLAWGDIIIATGSTCVNGSITQFVGKKPVVFFGVTVAGAAKVLGFDRYCRYPH
ncbi:MAG: DUF364 domain-containing protein [Syntrophorhabdaceae bacterium]|nr:DUF364 domain-containing protein [Syntrophorhabdaceae bacterium]